MFRALVLAAVVALGVGGVAAYRHLPWPAASAQPQSAAAGQETAAVEVARVRLDTVVEEIGAVGSLRADEAAVISAEIDGRVSELPFDEGVRVEAGRVLARLDASILESELAQAEAGLVLAQANFQRADKLFSQNSGTGRARDEALAALQSARASVALARTRLDKTVIRAPFAGVLGFRAISIGEFVTRGEELVTLRSIDPIKVDFRVPETALSAVAVGQTVTVTVDALPGRSFTGAVYAIDPQVDEDGRAIALRARIPNADGRLLPGLFARIVITAARREGARVIPESAVVPQGRQRMVYRVVDGRAVPTAVTLGQRRPGEVEVVEGLREGEVVVTAGQQRLRDGALVEIVSRTPGS